MPLNLTDDKSTLVQVMAWCHQATSHYLSQCWPRSMSPNGVTRPQRVKHKSVEFSYAHILHFSCQIILKFCTQHGSITAMLCAKFQNDLTTEMDVYGWMRFHEIWVSKKSFMQQPSESLWSATAGPASPSLTQIRTSKISDVDNPQRTSLKLPKDLERDPQKFHIEYLGPTIQGTTLRRARMPGTSRSCPSAHKLLWLLTRLGK